MRDRSPRALPEIPARRRITALAARVVVAPMSLFSQTRMYKKHEFTWHYGLPILALRRLH
jgi:hypothetical protein